MYVQILDGFLLHCFLTINFLLIWI